MTRKIFAIATALLAAPALFASAAEACISCEYVPEVVRGSQTSDRATPYVRERSYTSYTVERERSAPAKKRIVKSEPVAKKLEAADTAPIKKQANNENSSISAVAPKVASVENSSISVASTGKVEPVKITETKRTADAAKAIEPVKTPETKKSEPAVAQKIDCKKFFPSVGITLSVPCE